MATRVLLQHIFCSLGHSYPENTSPTIYTHESSSWEMNRSLLTPSEPPTSKTAQEVVTELTRTVIGKFKAFNLNEYLNTIVKV